ncbi:tyrosine-protein phosphatase [Catenulispora pinisilvae]|uniref:tyrosine-protein phosphatase n=1 Tax=Catenulispora pinisilvae TaxID=2705253 RepID=UPI0018918805|nr:tyrosine-protein phosphatase [Catenulispora pinisilvae]
MTDVPLTGIKNARDIGGLRTESGAVVRPLRLLRTARLNRPTEADLAWLASIGLRTVIDLRQSFEIAAWPDDLGDLPVERVNVAPTLDSSGTGTFFDLYLLWLDRSGDAFATAVKALARPGALPALVHCTAGKDRTGVLVAMVLDLLGVGDKAIVADYLISNENLSKDRGDIIFEHPISEELISGSLEHVRERFGSVAGYLAAHGVTDEEIAALRDGLLDG